MDKQKQIEEIQKILEYCCNDYDEKGRHIRNKCNSWDCEYYDETNGVCASYSLKEAIELYNAGYRKITENAVVLTEGEYSDLISDEVKTIERDIAEYWATEEVATVAKELHKYGYRKLDDHSILVLRKAKCLEEKTRKETAERFAERLKAEAVADDGVYYLTDYDIDKICKEFTGGTE